MSIEDATEETTAIEELLVLAESLTASGEIDDGTATRFNDVAARARTEAIPTVSTTVPVRLGVGGSIVGEAQFTVSGDEYFALIRIDEDAAPALSSEVKNFSISFRQGAVDNVG